MLIPIGGGILRAYQRKGILILIDSFVVATSILCGLLCRFDGVIPRGYINTYSRSIVFIISLNILVFLVFGIYNRLAQYASIDELVQILLATAVGIYISCIYGFITNNRFPISSYVIAWLIMFSLVGGVRISYRVFVSFKTRMMGRNNTKKRTMVVGAGEAGAMLIRELKHHQNLQSNPVVLVDDDPKKQHVSINGVPVGGDRYKIKHLAKKYKIDEIIVALPSIDKAEISDILQKCKETKCNLKILPGLYELIDGKINIKNIRDVKIEDLLGREEVKLNIDEIVGYIQDEVILVTGGGGSIGSELCRQIARYKPKELIILDIYENNAYDLQNELIRTYKDELNLKVLIASVRDRKRMEEIFNTYRPGVIFHAAAHKHVPLMEMNPSEAIKNNVVGTLNVAQCAHEFKAKRFVLISTDKAVNPTNIMGASKRVAEMIVQSLDNNSGTEFVAVRFGNVLGSNGSVIPLFQKQIEQGGPVTVTHPKITRYFMTISEAAKLVIQAGAMAQGGEIFILDMGECIKIDNLARDLIRLSGYVPDVDIVVEYTGLRPGEKLYEELLLAEEGLKTTKHPSIFVGNPLQLSYNEILLCVNALRNNTDDNEQLRECMKRVVPTYSYVSKLIEIALSDSM
jgi:FlaA1/EpsC-like NDP-sugar epimerase